MQAQGVMGESIHGGSCSLLPAAFPAALCQPRGHLLSPRNLPQNVGSTSSNRRVAALLFGQDSSLGTQSPRCQEVCPLPFVSCRKKEKPCWGQGLLVAWEQGKGSRGGESCGRLSGTACLTSGKTSLIYAARAIPQRVGEFSRVGAAGSAPSSILVGCAPSSAHVSLPCSVPSPLRARLPAPGAQSGVLIAGRPPPGGKRRGWVKLFSPSLHC